ncbi:MAG TPA: hypothetical protein VIG87_05720 [Candidatus Udaeobacter sp.]
MAAWLDGNRAALMRPGRQFRNPKCGGVRFLFVVALQIEELPPIIRDEVEDFLATHPRSPAALLRPKLGVVGTVWLAYIGPKLKRGTSGLGQTPRDALEDFNLRFMEPLISRNGFER